MRALQDLCADDMFIDYAGDPVRRALEDLADRRGLVARRGM